MTKTVLRLSATLGAALAFAGVAVPAASAGPPALLGGLPNLNGYCQSLGYSGITLIKGTNYGPGYAYANWRCVSASGDTHPFSMEQACKAQYGVEAIDAHPINPDDAYTWKCYATSQ